MYIAHATLVQKTGSFPITAYIISIVFDLSPIVGKTFFLGETLSMGDTHMSDKIACGENHLVITHGARM